MKSSQRPGPSRVSDTVDDDVKEGSKTIEGWLVLILPFVNIGFDIFYLDVAFPEETFFVVVVGVYWQVTDVKVLDLLQIIFVGHLIAGLDTSFGAGRTKKPIAFEAYK
ncbi:hypothetical protein HG531_009976 [Fusarium graminearum]|nr:hypothetical protein HG531_009976 [Fusarium graminearum]